MSWRRFMVLVRGLSPNSATVVYLQSQHGVARKGEEVVEVVGPEAAQRAFEGIFGPPPAPAAE